MFIGKVKSVKQNSMVRQLSTLNDVHNHHYLKIYDKDLDYAESQDTTQ